MEKSNQLSNRWLLLSYLFFFAIGLQAQQRTITGLVMDEENETLIGATVQVENSGRGTATDIDGAFSVQAATGEKLVISYTGYEAKTIIISVENNITVVLRSASEIMDEVVVVGYGKQKKRDVTGSVASISSEDLQNTVVTNLDQALQGRVAGVQVTQNSGQPGGAASIRIRGANSITGSSEPLYVIDGIPFQGDGASVAGFDWAGGANGQSTVNPLSTINPNDILTIDVLKDASSTAIYGARAANGVVLITTKRGENGKSKVSYNGYYALQTLPKKLGTMNLPEYATYNTEIARDLNLQPNQRFLDPTLLGQGTNWQDEIFRDAGMSSHQVSFSGGNDKTTYAISGGYFQQDGIVIGSDFERYTTRINLDNKVRDWLKVGGSLAYANTDETITLNDGGDGVIMQALVMPPSIAVRDFNGDFAGPSSNTSDISANPVGLALLRNNTLERQRLTANFYGDLEIFNGLSFRSEIGLDNNHSTNKAFIPTFNWGVLQNNQNQLRQRDEKSFFWIWKNYLTYNKQLGEKHNITALLGTEAQRSDWDGTVLTKQNFATNDIQVLSEGDDETSSITAFEGAQSLASYFGRFNYGYDDKYLVTLTLRADGSSKFGPNNRFGYFPSGAFAWRVSQEPFMENFKAIYDLKFRLGYGEVGNQAIGNYLFGSPLITVNTPFGTGYRLAQISNPDLKWETTKQFNAGIDLSLYDGRVDVTLDVYRKFTSDMLLQLSIPSYLGGTNYNDISAPFANVGSLENKGIDLSITTRNFVKKKFSWSTDLNFSLNRNKVVELDDDSRVYWRNLYWYSQFQTATQTGVGQPIGLFYGYLTDGLFQDQEDILSHAVQVNNGSDQNFIDKNQGVWIGDIKFKDLNGDGKITTEDQTIIGDPNPDFTFGINNDFVFGPFGLTVYLQGSYGADVLNYSRVVLEGQTGVFNNQASTVNDRAQLGLIDENGSTFDATNVYLLNPESNIPRPTTTDINGNNRASDRWIEDGSFLRIQNLRLSYTLPTDFTKKYQVERLRFYVNAQNIYTFTNYSGYDPEIGAFNQDPLLQNVDLGRYPSPRLYTFGLDVDF